MYPNLVGKVGFGVPDLYAALTYQYPKPVLTLMSDQNQGGTRGAVIASVTHIAEAFPVRDAHNFSTDGYARIMLFATNLSLSPLEESASVITVTANKSGKSPVKLPVEYAGSLANAPIALSQINVRLTDDVATWGDTQITLTIHGQTSNPVTVNIK